MLSMTILCGLANYFAKMSILLFIKRIFPRVVSRTTAYAILFGIIFNTVAYSAITIYTCAMCIPRVGSGGSLPAQCSGPLMMSLGTAGAAINATLDLYVLAVSIPSLWILQMPMRKKYKVVGVLTMGLG